MELRQDWFEMADIRRRTLKNAVWIPLRAMQQLQMTGHYGHSGYRKEFFGVGTVAVPVENKRKIFSYGWRDIGISHNHGGFYDRGRYISAEIFEDRHGAYLGMHLVLDQHFNSIDIGEWHLSQDFVTAIGLKREGDVWVRPDEGYIEVARLHRNADRKPILMQVRAEHLKDYLCARNMGLYATSYNSRNAVTEDASFIVWDDRTARIETKTEEWHGWVRDIHEGGNPYGEKMAVVHAARTDVDESDDIPDISAPPTNANIKSSSWEKAFTGRKLAFVVGELWRKEWVEPGKRSPRIRRDDEGMGSISFIIDEQGERAAKDKLLHSGRWLWFKPDVITALAKRRGGSLTWYTRDTGAVSCSPDCTVHFGINKLSLINVYAKDVAVLPEWQQRIWAGHNVGPDGGVSEELLASQVKAEPARTLAPEKFLHEAVKRINVFSEKQLNICVFREHDSVRELLPTIHRFRAIDQAGFYALAKDIARVVVDDLDVSAMQTIVRPPRGTNWGSLKTLENLLAVKIGTDHARSLLSPLVGAYELRLADAHLPSKELDKAMSLVGVDSGLPFVFQGYQLLDACVSSIFDVAEVLDVWDKIDAN